MRAATRRHALIAAIRRDEGVVFPALSPAEWNALATDAMALGVGGQLHERTSRAGATLPVPPADAERLRAHYYAIAARNAKMLSTLGDVLRRFSQEGIRVIVLKGAALVEGAYADFGARTMDDLDLLVGTDDLDRAAEALRAIGFEPNEWFGSAEWYRGSLHHLVPFRRDGVIVEVHHRLLPPGQPQPLEPAELWRDAVPATVANVPALRLSPTHEIAYLLHHLALSHHFVGGLGRLRDIQAVAASTGGRVDWEAVARASRGVERATWVALTLVRDATGLEVPDAALDGLLKARPFGALERRLAVAVASRLSVRVGDATPIPEWASVRLIDELIAEHGWLQRSWNLASAIVAGWRNAGRKRGLRWLAIPYGIFVAPLRRLSGRRGSERPAN